MVGARLNGPVWKVWVHSSFDNMLVIANIVTTSKALVTTSKALVTTSGAKASRRLDG